MSTTITYKDNLLTTVDNSIKVLRTGGKYLEGDIVVADITAKSQANENDPIRFFDYDGTLVASYTEVPESLPEAPTHEGLIAQGWNWTLEDIATQFASSGACDVGQMYTTSDGKTRIYVTVSNMTKSFWLGLAPSGTLSIDWGDDSKTSSMTGTSYTTIKTVYHEYAMAGSYIISVEAVSGGFAFCNANSSYTRLLGKYESDSNYYNRLYSKCVTAIELGEGARVGDNAFTTLLNMRSITIPDTVTNINKYAFFYCYALESITIPNTVTRIDDCTFCGCYALESVTIPNTVKSINSSAFQDCYVLKHITIPNGVTSIGTYAFQNCYALESITIPDRVTSISNSAFLNCYTLEFVTIPDTITSVGPYAFKNCFMLESITIPNTVTSVGTYAFQGCQTLKHITIPDGMTNIGTYMFSGCYSLGSITIPNGVTSIGTYAFQNCYNMEYHFLPTTPPTLANPNTFQNIQPGCKIYVPYSADHSILNAYKTATNWSAYAKYMVEEGE